MRYTNQKSEVVDLPNQTLLPAIREVASVFRRHRLSYDQTAYVVRRARSMVELRNERSRKALPLNLTREELRRFIGAVDASGNPEHSLMYRLLLYTGMRVSELTSCLRASVDIESCQVRVIEGKGRKDRIVLFPRDLQLPVRLHLEATQGQTYLFETIRREALSTRWVQVLTKRYGHQAGIEKMHPHRLRHSLMTELARPGTNPNGSPRAPMSAELRAILAGHASSKTQDVYTHLALTDVADAYQGAVKGLLD